MIGVETLPEKKKREDWKFDKGACSRFTKSLLFTAEVLISRRPQSTHPVPTITLALKLMSVSLISCRAYASDPDGSK